MLATHTQKNMRTSYIADNHRNYMNAKLINIRKFLDGFLFKLTTKSAVRRLPGDMALVNLIAKKIGISIFVPSVL
jgi:hypothetical protein